jgi:hypothetical protein
MYYNFAGPMSPIQLGIEAIAAVIFIAYISWPFVLAFLVGYAIVSIYKLFKK